jgi:hypothetical protein
MTSLNVKPVFATIVLAAAAVVLSSCASREIYEETRTVEYGDGGNTIYRTEPVTTVYREQPMSVVTTTSDYGNCGCAGNGTTSYRDVLSEIQRLNSKVDKIYNEVKTLGYE